MKTRHSLVLGSLLALTTILVNAKSNIDRAKILVRGAKIYRQRTLARLYDFLENAGLEPLAGKLKNSIEAIEQIENAIEANLKEKLSPEEAKQRKMTRTTLEQSQIMMNAKVINEINKIFNVLDNITSNLEKDVLDYREEQRELMPSIKAGRAAVASMSKKAKRIKLKIKNIKRRFAPQLKAKKLQPNTAAYDKELIKRAPAIPKLRKQLTRLREQINRKKKWVAKREHQLFPKLKNYYERMKKDSSGLLKHAKKLGKKMLERADAEQKMVTQYKKQLNQLAQKRADKTLLKKSIKAKKQHIKTMNEIQAKVAKLSESEQRLWGILSDLYHRVLLTLDVISSGPSSIEKWSLIQILRIKLPRKKSKKRRRKQNKK